MSDFDDRAREAGRRIRDRADELASNPAVQTGSVSIGPEPGSTRRWAALAAVAAVIVGLIGLVVVDRASEPDGSVDTVAPVTEQPNVETTPPIPRVVDPATSEPTTTEPTTVPVAPPPAVALTMPHLGYDSRLCSQRTAAGSLEPITFELTPFWRTDEPSIPLQIIGDPELGAAGPFALVQRYFHPGDRYLGGDAATYGNGNGSAVWELPDGSKGYLRSRGLTSDEIATIVEHLTPRPADASIPGFDYFADAAAPPATLLMHAEQNNDAVSLAGYRITCTDPTTGFEYWASVYAGDPVAMHAAVIDRSPPLEVELRGDAVVVNGMASGTSSWPSIDDIIELGDEEWAGIWTPTGGLSEHAIEAPPPTASIGQPNVDDVVVVDLDAATTMIPSIPLPERIEGPAIQIANGDTYRTNLSGSSLCITSTDLDGSSKSGCGIPSETGGLLTMNTTDDNDQVTAFILTAAATELSFVPEDCAATWISTDDDLALRACQTNSDAVRVNFKLPNDPATYRFNLNTQPIRFLDETD